MQTLILSSSFWLSSKTFSLNVTPRKITFLILFSHWVVCPYLLQRLIWRISLILGPGMSGSLPISPLINSVLYLFCFKNQIFSLIHENFCSSNLSLQVKKWQVYFPLGLLKKALRCLLDCDRILCYFVFLGLPHIFHWG